MRITRVSNLTWLHLSLQPGWFEDDNVAKTTTKPTVFILQGFSQEMKTSTGLYETLLQDYTTLAHQRPTIIVVVYIIITTTTTTTINSSRHSATKYTFPIQLLLHQIYVANEASTRLPQIFLFLLLSTASLMFIPCAVRSSFTLSIHFFG